MKEILQEINDVLMKHKDVPRIDLSESIREVSAQIEKAKMEENLGVKIHDKYAIQDGFLILNEFMDLLHYQSDVEDLEDDGDQLIPAGWYLRMRFTKGPYIFNKMYPKDAFNKFLLYLKNEYKADYSDIESKRLSYNVETNNNNVRRLLREFDGILQKYKEIAIIEVRDKLIAKKEEELRILKGE